MSSVLRGIDEAWPGPEWRDLFEACWPSYERWFLSGGDAARPGLVEARWHLHRFMPELLPVWRRLVELAGGSERVARFLALYRPAPFLSGCSQLILAGDEPLLVRNYDYAPWLWEASALRTRWSGRRVLAMGDCLWGALDGVNEDGLALALAFGGRRVVGDGFGIPLVVRYLLETCRDVRDAAEALSGIPVHMAYNLSAVDASGDHFTAEVGPGHRPHFSHRRVATNHQLTLDWPEHAEATKSREREIRLGLLVDAGPADAERLGQAFLAPPLFSSAWDRGFGTLYTAIYRPASRSLQLHWPGASRRLEIESFAPFSQPLVFAAEAPGAEDAVASASPRR